MKWKKDELHFLQQEPWLLNYLSNCAFSENQLIQLVLCEAPKQYLQGPTADWSQKSKKNSYGFKQSWSSEERGTLSKLNWLSGKNREEWFINKNVHLLTWQQVYLNHQISQLFKSEEIQKNFYWTSTTCPVQWSLRQKNSS